MLIPPDTPLKKMGNYRELQIKSPFAKGGFKNLQVERIYDKGYRCPPRLGPERGGVFFSSRPEIPPDKVPLLAPALDFFVEARFQQAVQHLLDQRPRLIA